MSCIITENILPGMIKYFGDDARRINHAIKVLGYASAIAIAEKISSNEKRVIGLASILHDIGIKEAELKYQSSAGNYQEIEGPPIAKKIMEESGVPGETVSRVCYIIANHHSYKKIDGLDFQVLVEADFIVNAFEDNIDKKAIGSMSEKLFKTATGKEILRTMYL